MFNFNGSGNPARSVINAYNVRNGGGNGTLNVNSGGTTNIFTDTPFA